jgi:hypothetical protein
MNVSWNLEKLFLSQVKLFDNASVEFIVAYWFHNVLALEPCIAVNIFWKHLSDDFYQKKDLYGNKV